MKQTVLTILAAFLLSWIISGVLIEYTNLIQREQPAIYDQCQEEGEIIIIDTPPPDYTPQPTVTPRPTPTPEPTFEPTVVPPYP